MLPYDLRRQLWWFGLVQAHLLVQALPFLRVQFIHFSSNHFALVYHGPEESRSLSARAAVSFRTGVCPLAGSKWGSAFDTVFSVWRLHVRNKCILWHIIYTCWLQRDTVLLHLLPQTPHDLRAVSLFFPWTNCTRVYRAIQVLGNALPTFLLWYSISTAYYHTWSTMWHWVYVDTSVQKYISRGFSNIQCNRMQILQQLYIVRHPSTSTICIIYIYNIYTINIYICI